MIHAALMLAVLASIGRAAAITESEQIAFSGVDTLQVRMYQSNEQDLVSGKQLRTKFEFVLRTAGVPVDPNDFPRGEPWIGISVVAYEMMQRGGGRRGDWAYAVYIGLYEVTTLWRNGQMSYQNVATWASPLVLGTGSKMEARDGLIDSIVEVAEEVSNLYLATH